MPLLRRTVSVAGVAVAALLLLGACAPAVPIALHTPGHHHHASASPTPSATPTPTPVAAPIVRIPLTCEQLAPAAQVSSVLGAPEVLDNKDQSKGDPWLVSDLEPYAYIQDGTQACNYATPAATDLTFYRAYFMPDASLALWTPYFAQLSAPSKFNITPSPFGANSNLNCESQYHIFDCDLEMLVGSTWISLYGNSDEYPATTIAATEAKFLPLFTTAVNAIKAATIAEPLWSDPAATAVNISSNPASLNTVLAAAVGSSINTQENGYGPTIEEATDESVIPVHFYYFNDYAGNYALNIDVLPQGSWAWSAISAAASAKPDYAALAGIGDEAFSFRIIGGESPYEYAIVVEKGHNLFSVEADTPTVSASAGTLAIAEKAAKAIAGQIS
jgi:hypothetical protein